MSFLSDLNPFGPGNSGNVSGQIQGVSPGQLQTNQQLQALYNQFQQQKPSMAQDLQSNASEQAAQNSMQNDQGIRAGASQRGLLYSGIREGAQAQNASNTASGLAQSRAGINQNLYEAGNKMGQQVYNAGMSVADQEFQREQSRYNLALTAAGQRANVIGGLLGGAGAVAGTAAAGQYAKGGSTPSGSGSSVGGGSSIFSNDSYQGGSSGGPYSLYGSRS